MHDAPTVELLDLSKRYGRSTNLALNQVSLKVFKGEVYGFLGANGAGKSTTIRTLLNFIQPSSGSATILGFDIVAQSVEVKRHIGYLSGEFAAYGGMTGSQFLKYMAELQPPKHKNTQNELAHMFDAELDKPIIELSKGNRQKIGIIQAFMHEPDVLILDEPTSGLDPLRQESFYKLVRSSCQRGASVFVSSHNFTEVQRMCDRVGFIREGKLVAEKTLADMANQAAHTFNLTFKDEAPIHQLRQINHTEVTSIDSRHVTISIQGELTPLFKVLANYHVLRLEQQEVNLEEEFLRFYKGSNA